MHLSVLPEYMPVHHIQAWCLQNPEDGIRYSRSGVISMSHRVCWELNSGLRTPQNLTAISSAPWLAFLNELGQHIIQPEDSYTNSESSCSCNHSWGPLISTWRHSLQFLCCSSENSSFWIDGTSRLGTVELKTPNQYCFVFFFQTL